MRIALLFDDVATRPEATLDERGVLEALEAVDVALRDLGHTPVRVGVGGPLEQWVGELREADVDLVFNLCEGAYGASANEPRVAAAVELLGLPLTGSSAETLALARRKDRVNALLAAADLPVPHWVMAREGTRVTGWRRYPALVKPVGEDASVGITQESVARDRRELGRALAVAARYGPVMVQEFLTGREFNVGIVGEQVLPVAEIEFGEFPQGAWPLVTYRAKWEAGSGEDLATTPRCPARIDEALRARAVALARMAWALVDGRGYGRVDLRADANGRLYILEVNPNPDLAPSAGLARMATAHGWGYADLIAAIVREARP